MLLIILSGLSKAYFEELLQIIMTFSKFFILFYLI
jgi:hypothetical protein